MGWIIAIIVAFFIIKAIASSNKTTQNNTVSSKQTSVVTEPIKSAVQYPTEKRNPPVVQPPVSSSATKCPVCRAGLPSGAEKCSSCGFDELQREFINADDAASWFENVIVPYRVKWEQSKNQPAYFTADELYAQMAAKQSKRIISQVDETASEFETIPYKDGVEISRYNGTSASIIIPNRINGKTVLRLGNSLFENCKWITEVVLPNELISIGSKAFRYTALTHIVFPHTIEELGAEAFAYSSITEIVFPPSVKKIPDRLCEKCEKLKTVIIMSAVEIGEYAFGFCSAVTKLALPETLVTIKNEAFCCCHGLDTIVLPASVRSAYTGLSGSMRGSVVVLNDDLVWTRYRSSSTIHSWITVYCNPGSTSQEYARSHGMKMKLLSEYQL